MKKLSIFLVIFMYAFTLLSQDEVEKYKIFSSFPVNVTHKYDFTENTTVKRTYSDSSQIEYSKIVVYHMSLMAPNAPKDGFQPLEISIDSLKYKFKDDKYDIDYNSQSNVDVPPFNVFDYEKTSVLLGKEYEFDYNPYYEIIDVKGDRLAEQLYRLNDPKKGMRDPLRKYVWLDQLSNEHLEFASDLRKGLFPPFRAQMDTTWKTTSYLELEGIALTDSLEMTLTDFDIKNFTIVGKSFDIKTIDKDVVLHTIKDRSQVLSADGNIDYLLKVSPRGNINYLQIDIDLNVKLKNVNEIYNQHYITTYTWELDKMLKY